MIKDLIVIGSGNPDIVRLIDDINASEKSYNFIGFLEKDESLHYSEKYGYPVLGGDDQIQKYMMKNVQFVNNVYFSQETRQNTHTNLLFLPGEKFCNLIHPTVNKKIKSIGTGNIIYDFVVIQNQVVIGDHNILHSSSIIGHETRIGSNNLFSVNVSIGSRAKIGNYCFFGISSTLLPSLSVADFTYAGGGAVINHNINQKCIMFGNPARILPKKNE